MSQLNYHHLKYFYAVAEAGNLTNAAALLNVSQSSVSVQIKQLELSLGVALFDREHKSLQLTEEGKIALHYARSIFRTGEELIATIGNKTGPFRQKLHVGAVATLSRNFQLHFLRSVIADKDVEVIIHSGSLSELLERLESHELDLILSNSMVQGKAGSTLRTQLVDKQKVSLFRHPQLAIPKNFRLPQGLQGIPLILPTQGNDIRTAFDLLVERAGVSVLIAAEADDMAMLRLLAREIHGMAVLPPVVVKEELQLGTLVEVCALPSIHEHFYAVTTQRRYPNPLLKRLME